jgi:SAM-dependent methyltransferase
MSGFDKDWLALREPADARARNPELMQLFARVLDEASLKNTILDIGCGTGSTFRSLQSAISPDAAWRLMDYDARLIGEAKRRIGQNPAVKFVEGNINELAALPLDNVAVVTASALFDLCSAELIAGLTKTLSKTGIGLYAALNYDGDIGWSRSHPLDGEVVAGFNYHQRTDKGMGVALGPAAWTELAKAFSSEGYQVDTAQSPWIMGPDDGDLQHAFLIGMAAPVVEVGRLRTADVEDWLQFRLDAITDPGSSCVVGHVDVFARR